MPEKINQTLLDNPYIKPMYETMMGTVASILEVAPKVLIGIVLFLIGLVLFKLIRKVLVSLLKKVGADSIADKMGIGDMLRKFGIRKPFTEVLGAVIFYLLMFNFLVELTAALDLTMISEPLGRIVLFLPNVITATIIFMAGFIVTDLIRQATLRGAEGLGLDYAKTLSNLLYGFLLILVTILAVRELEIETGLIENTVLILLAALGLAVAIALGFGLQGLAKNVVSGAYARDAFPTGSAVNHDGEEYNVSYVGSISTKIEREDGSYVMIPNAELVGQPVKGRSRA